MVLGARCWRNDMGKPFLLALAFSLVLPVVASADVAKGVWRTQPDDKGQVGHVKVSTCGAALCGTITEAYDKAGRKITTPNVGKRILFDMKEGAAGRYEGRVLIPMFNRSLNGKMEVSGKRMKLSGCLLGICDSQTWVRVR